MNTEPDYEPSPPTHSAEVRRTNRRTRQQERTALRSGQYETLPTFSQRRFAR